MEFIKTILYYPFINILTLISDYVPGHNVLWGVIGLTLLVRFILLIPSKRAAQAQRKLSQLQPMMEELKAEYGNDRQGLAQAQMDLYKQNNINPFASCLPALIQLPILIILYQAILHGLTNSDQFLYSWVPRPDNLQTTLLGINLLQSDKTFIFPAIAAILQYVQIRMTMPNVPKVEGSEPDATQLMQRQTMYILPLFTLFFAHSFPAAIAVYWIVTTAFTIVQQYYVNKENLKLTGVAKALKEGDAKHPENHAQFEKVKDIVEKTEKKGVSVTVRRKK
jgi:YidC/Oxa1 family membrane protein insertase